MAEVEEIRPFVYGDAPPALRLRAAMSINLRPPSELLEPVVIGQALTLEDCCKFFRQLASVRRVLEAGPVLEAIRNLLAQREVSSLRALIARFLRISRYWEGNKGTLAPSAATVAEFLSLVEVTFDRRPRVNTRGSQKPNEAKQMARLLAVACGLAAEYPTVDNLLVTLRSLIATQRRQEILLTQLYDDVPALADAVSSVRSLAASRLEVAATRAEIDDFRKLLQVLTDFPARKGEKDEVIAHLFEDRARFDTAISRILWEAVEGNLTPAVTVRLAPSSEPTQADLQLATALLRAWAARDDGPNAREAYEQLRSALESFFSLRLRDHVGETQEYNPRLHEFGFGESPSSKVEVVRPSVDLVQAGEVGVVVKALVKPSRS